MQKYASKKSAAPQAASLRKGEKAPEAMSKSEMLHLSGAGAPQPMSPALREKFEPSFGADFSNIRISRGHIPEEMGVQAVAKGTDILLDSRAGMDVIGHELAHVVQQAQGQVQGGFPVVHNAALEHQADVMGARAASGLSAMEGGMSGLGGGEMMAIAPMSDASAPAQCKSYYDKQLDKTKGKIEALKKDPTWIEGHNRFVRDKGSAQYTPEEKRKNAQMQKLNKKKRKYEKEVKSIRAENASRERYKAAQNDYQYSMARQQAHEEYDLAKRASDEQRFGKPSRKRHGELSEQVMQHRNAAEKAREQSSAEWSHLHDMKYGKRRW